MGQNRTKNPLILNYLDSKLKISYYVIKICLCYQASKLPNVGATFGTMPFLLNHPLAPFFFCPYYGLMLNVQPPPSSVNVTPMTGPSKGIESIQY